MTFSIADCIKDLQMVAISEGAGSGTKLFQSLLDSHPNVLMVPGYALMYFYPFWEAKILPRQNLCWPDILQAILAFFPSLFDTRKLPGSEGLDQLGESQTETLGISEAEFGKTFLAITENENINARAALIATHIAYAMSAGEDLQKKKVLVYHIHVFFYVEKYLRQDFPCLKVIASIRDPRPNLGRRVENSVLKPNEQKLRDTDFFLMRHAAYCQIIRFTCEGLDSLAKIPRENVRVFRHEDLVTRPESVMSSTADFINIPYDAGLLKPTWGGLPWYTTYYDFDSTKHIANPDVISSDWQTSQSKQDILFIEGLCLSIVNKYYGTTLVFDAKKMTHCAALLVLCALPRVRELRELTALMRVDKYAALLVEELKNLKILKSYQGNLFYELKWTNNGIDFSKRDLLLNTETESGPQSIALRVAYLVERSWRYLAAFPSCVVSYLMRVKLSMSAIWRGLKGRRVLPDVL